MKHILELRRLCDSLTLVGEHVLTYLHPRPSLESSRVQGAPGAVLGAAIEAHLPLSVKPRGSQV